MGWQKKIDSIMLNFNFGQISNTPKKIKKKTTLTILFWMLIPNLKLSYLKKKTRNSTKSLFS